MGYRASMKLWPLYFQCDGANWGQYGDKFGRIDPNSTKWYKIPKPTKPYIDDVSEENITGQNV